MARSWLLALIVAAALAGCTALQQFPDVSENYTEDLVELDHDYAAALAKINGETGGAKRKEVGTAEGAATKDEAGADEKTGTNAPVSEEERKRIRNEEIDGRLAVIDANFENFRIALSQENVKADFGVSLVEVGVGGAGALVSETASQILSAVSGGLAGAQAAYSKAALYEKALSALLQQMIASRNAVLVKIFEGRTRSYDEYPLSAAVHDLHAYYFAGSLPGAIVATSADAQVKNAEAKGQLVEITTRRSKEFVEPDRQERVDKILDAIGELADDKAFDLEKSPPIENAEVDAIIKLRDPANQRDTNADVAREMLKMRAVLSQRDDEALGAWEAAVKAAE